MEHNVGSYLELSFYDSSSVMHLKKLIILGFVIALGLSITKICSYQTYNYTKNENYLKISCKNDCDNIQNSNEIIINKKIYDYSVVSSEDENVYLKFKGINLIDEQGIVSIKGKRKLAISSLINIFKERS